MKPGLKNILFLIVLIPSLCFGRYYKTKEILAKSDSILEAKAGHRFIPYYKLSKGSYYEYVNSKKKSFFRPLLKKKTCHLGLKSIYVKYDFMMPYPACKWYDTIRGSVIIELGIDSELTLTKEPEINFIPDFAEQNYPCNFISMDSAITIAQADSMKSGVTPPYAYVKYYMPKKRWVWVVLRTIWNNEDFNNDKPTKDDMVIIDAVNAWVLEHKVIPFAPHIN